MCVCVREREREIDRDREIERERVQRVLRKGRKVKRGANKNEKVINRNS